MPALLQRQADLLLGMNPAAIGISLCFPGRSGGRALPGKLLKQQSSVPVDFGGSFFIDTGTCFLASTADACDYAVSGEGEQAALRPDCGSFPVKPARRRRGCQASLTSAAKISSPNPEICEQDLDRLGAPDFSDFDLKRYFFAAAGGAAPGLARLLLAALRPFCVHYRSGRAHLPHPQRRSVVANSSRYPRRGRLALRPGG